MRWLADDCVAGLVVVRLREAGHDVIYMAELAPSSSDPDVIALAHREGRILLTEDKDFGELVFRLKWLVPGLVLMRIAPDQNALKWTRLKTAIETFGDRFYGRYFVVEEARFRSRPLHNSGHVHCIVPTDDPMPPGTTPAS